MTLNTVRSLLLLCILCTTPVSTAEESLLNRYYSAAPQPILLNIDTYSDDLGSLDYLRVALSHDGQMLAMFEALDVVYYSKSNKEGLSRGRIRIYDTSTTKLLHETVLDDIKNLDHSHVLEFLPSNDVLLLHSFKGSSSYLWEFNKKDKTPVKTCTATAGGFIADTSSDDEYILYKTYDGFYVLCGLHDELRLTAPAESVDQLYVSHMREWTFTNLIKSNNVIVLHNKELLIIYNFDSKQGLSSGDLFGQASKKIDFWNLNYRTTGTKIFTSVDKKNKILALFEVFDDKTILTRWDYEYRKKLGSEQFDFPINNIIDNEEISNDRYVLMLSKTHIAFIDKSEGGYGLKWRQSLTANKLDAGSFTKIITSKNNKKLFFVPNVRHDEQKKHKHPLVNEVDAETGKVTPHFVEGANAVSYFYKLVPSFDGSLVPFVKESYSKNANTTYFYDTASRKTLGRVDNMKLISKDHQIIVTLNGNRLAVWQKQK